MKLITFTLLLATIFSANVFAQDNHCLDFNGTSNYVAVNDFPISGDFTLSTWFKCNATSNVSFEERILSFGPTSRLEIGIEDFTDKLWLFDQSSNTVASYGDDLRDNTWHQVTYVKEGIERSVYLDGVLVGEYDSSTSAVYGDNFRIGAWTGGGGTPTFFNGKVDETRIWSVAKTPEEIAETLSCPINGDEENLVAYWDYDQGNPGGDNALETVLLDRSSNGNNANLTSNFMLLGNSSNWVAADNPGLFYLDASFSQDGNELVANATDLNYQWLDCNDSFSEIAGATTDTFAPGASGSYALEVNNMTCTEVSDCLEFVPVNTKEVLNELDVLVYPNPTADYIVVDKKVDKELNLVITDQLGRMLLVENMTQQSTEIDLRDLPKGLYYVTVENIVRKIVKL